MSAIDDALQRVGCGESTAADEDLLRAALAQLEVKLVAASQALGECLAGFKLMWEERKHLSA